MFTAPRTFINPTVPSVDTDLCDNVAAVREHIETRNERHRPLFTYLAPMNVHILNTRSASGGPGDSRYAGFYHTYAAALERVDSCFGTFLTYLKHRGLYDNSIIILTSDHGESLGSDNNWGHQFFLFPENVRIPMIDRYLTAQIPDYSRSQIDRKRPCHALALYAGESELRHPRG